MVAMKLSSRLQLEHRELALHQSVAVACERQAILRLELLDLTALHALPRPFVADVIWEVGEGFVCPADQVQVVVGEGAEGVALRADQLPLLDKGRREVR
jgi:hypothetical protein